MLWIGYAFGEEVVMLNIGSEFRLAHAARIAPQQFIHDFIVFSLWIIVYLKRSVYLLDLQHVFKRMAYASMRAKDVFLN
jgi:hypothetical protein